MAPDIRVGIVGWNYPEWKGLVYPEKAKPAEFLKHYAERFPLVEAASSYYGMPKRETAEHWADETPATFRISLKVPDWILQRSGPDLASALETFLDRLAPLGERLDTLVAQFHPSFTREKGDAALRAFVATLPRGPRWAVELRHPSWWHGSTYDLLSGSDITLVWSDLGHLRTPPVVTSDALYLRLFGDRELAAPYDRKRRDATATLAAWAERVHEAAPRVKRVDVLVSKFLEGYAPASAATMSERLGLPPPQGIVRAGRKTAEQQTLD